jgi:hypothetical protein
MRRCDILNAFIHARSYSSYLEIGVRRSADNFDRIQCRHKVGVDPAPLDVSSSVQICTSDAFFQKCTETFDIIFVDGLHEEKQVARDITNSLLHLNRDGVVMIHDALPPTAWHQRPLSEVHGGAWNGTVWKAVLNLFAVTDQLCYVINTDCGCAIIDTSKLGKHSMSTLTLPLIYERDFKLIEEYVVSVTTFVNDRYCALGDRND